MQLMSRKSTPSTASLILWRVLSNLHPDSKCSTTNLPALLLLPDQSNADNEPSYRVALSTGVFRSSKSIINMPPKFDPNSPENAALITLFTQLGLSSKSASDIVRQPKQVAPLKALVEEFSLADKSLDEKQASALVKLSAGCGKLGQSEKAYIVDKVIKGDLKTGDQVSGELRRPMQFE